MKFFFDIGNRYMEASDWKDMALVKFCLFSMGVLVCALLPDSVRSTAAWIAGGVFVVTYIPLMAKVFRIMREKQD